MTVIMRPQLKANMHRQVGEWPEHLHWLVFVVTLSLLVNNSHAESMCERRAGENGCRWPNKKLLEFKGCLPEEDFSGAYKDDPFRHVRMPELYKRNPEACLLQCVDAKVYDMAAMVDDECWCSPAAEVEIFAQPEFSNETCGRECLDTLDNKLRFNCSHLAGFFSLKSNVENLRYSLHALRDAPPQVLVNSVQTTKRVANITTGAAVTISCQSQLSDGESDVLVQWYRNGIPVTEGSFLQCDGDTLVNSSSGEIRFETFSDCVDGVYTCIVSLKEVCITQYGCSEVSITLVAQDHDPRRSTDEVNTAAKKSSLSTGVKYGVAAGVTTSVVVVIVVIVIAYRSRRNWDPSTAGPAYRCDPAPAGDGTQQENSKPFVSSNTLQRVRASFRSSPKKSDKTHNGEASPGPNATAGHSAPPLKAKKSKPMLPKPRKGGLGILKVPPKPPRLGKEPAAVPAGYSAVGMTPPVSANGLDKKKNEEVNIPLQESSAYAVSNVRRNEPGNPAGEYSLIADHPLEAKLSSHAQSSRQGDGKPVELTQSLNYADLDLPVSQATSSTPGSGEGKAADKTFVVSPEAVEKTCYAALIPEAHLKGVRRASDGTQS